MGGVSKGRRVFALYYLLLPHTNNTKNNTCKGMHHANTMHSCNATRALRVCYVRIIQRYDNS